MPWRQDLIEDRNRLATLLSAACAVTADRDAKLAALKQLIARKRHEPINKDNCKLLLFTAFADTAEYLYRELASWAGRPIMVRTHASFSYQAGSWDRKRRVVAKVEWHPGQLYPTLGFIVTNLTRPARRVVAFYNMRGTCEQYIKEGKGAIKWTRLSCRTFAANAVRLQLHALAYNLGNFLCTLATPEPIKDWSLTSLKEKLIKIGAKVISPGRYVAFQMAEVAIPRQLFADILWLIAELRPPPDPEAA